MNKLILAQGFSGVTYILVHVHPTGTLYEWEERFLPAKPYSKLTLFALPHIHVHVDHTPHTCNLMSSMGCELLINVFTTLECVRFHCVWVILVVDILTWWWTSLGPKRPLAIHGCTFIPWSGLSS